MTALLLAAAAVGLLAGLMGKEWMKRSLRYAATAAAWVVLGGILLLTVVLPLEMFFFWPD